jgi:hypothetical protein
MIAPTIILGVILDLLGWAFSLLTWLDELPISVDPVAALLALASLLVALSQRLARSGSSPHIKKISKSVS